MNTKGGKLDTVLPFPLNRDFLDFMRRNSDFIDTKQPVRRASAES
jgi:hypothetical protein